MGFSNRQQAHYAKFKDGKVQVYRGKNAAGEAQFESYDQVTGNLVDIHVKIGEYQGEETQSWQIVLMDAGEKTILSFGYSSGFARGFFNALANADITKPLTFWCYEVENERGKFNAPSMAQDEKMLKWKYTDVPKTETVTVGTKKVIDDTKAVEWMLGVVAEINAKLQANKQSEDTAAIAGKVFDVDKGIPSDLPWDDESVKPKDELYN